MPDPDPHPTMLAIAAIDEQIALEAEAVSEAQERINEAKHDLAEAMEKLGALHDARAPLARVSELYTGVPSPPPAMPMIDDTAGPGVTGGPGVPPPRRRVTQPKRTDAEFIDAVRSSGGRSIAAEVAVKLGLSEHCTRDRLKKLVHVGQLESQRGEVAALGGRPATLYVIPAPKPGSPDPDEPPEVLDAAAAAAKVREQDNSPSSLTASAMRAAGIPEAGVRPASDDAADGQPYDQVDAKNGEVLAPPPPAAKRASASLARLPKREAPSAPTISPRTQRHIAAGPKPAARAASTLPDRLMLIFEAGDPTAEWKPGELVLQYSRRWPGAVPSTIDVGHALTLLMGDGKITSPVSGRFHLPARAA